MTLSIGVVTNQFQDFSHSAQVSELAAEMKTYAKSLPGSKYVVDRRHGAALGVAATGQGDLPAAEPAAGSDEESAADENEPTSSGVQSGPA